MKKLTGVAGSGSVPKSPHQGYEGRADTWPSVNVCLRNSQSHHTGTGEHRLTEGHLLPEGKVFHIGSSPTVDVHHYPQAGLRTDRIRTLELSTLGVCA